VALMCVLFVRAPCPCHSKLIKKEIRPMIPDESNGVVEKQRLVSLNEAKALKSKADVRAKEKKTQVRNIKCVKLCV